MQYVVHHQVEHNAIDGQPAKVDDPIILVGANESYEPRCAHHIVASTSDEEEM